MMGIPPINHALIPVDLEFSEGALSMAVDGLSYGDGSGVRQQSDKFRFATWAVVRGSVSANGEWRTRESMRGVISGWLSTVHRGELKALVEHLRHAGLAVTYVGDCKDVLDGVRDGIPPALTSARNPNADLWREAQRLIQQHGTTPLVKKTKAHRSRASAVGDRDDGLEHWLGNDAADTAAKSLARQLAAADNRPQEDEEHRAAHRNIMARVAFGTAWRFRHRTALQSRQSQRAEEEEDERQLDEGERHIFRQREDGTTECQRCRRMAGGKKGLSRLWKSPCQGDIAGKFHGSHDMLFNDGVWWCRLCGAFSARWPRQLLMQCSGYPRSEAQKNVLNRLRSGRPPTTAAYLVGVRALEISTSAEPVNDRRSSHDNRHVPPSTGRYLRLAGGPLHRCTDGAASITVGGDAEADLHPQAAHVHLPRASSTYVDGQRSQIRGDSHDQAGCAGKLPVASLCQPARAEGWAARIRGAPSRCKGSCSACATATVTRCRQCGRPLCIACAKGALHCGSFADAPG